MPDVFEMGDRTAIPPYDYDAMRVVAHDMPPIVRASWLRGVSALPNTFAHESYIDELATEAGVDPIEYRLRYLKDPRAVDLVNAVAKRADWTPRPVWKEPAAEGDIVRGRGFAYALYVHSKFPGYGAAWSAWIADVAVNKATGDVSVTRVVAGQDSGLMINPDGVRHQIHGNVIQSTSRALMEEVSFDRNVGDQPRMGRLPDHQIPGHPEDRRLDAAAAGPAAARRRRIRFGPECRGDRQRHLRRHRRAVSRIAVHAGADSGGIARRSSRHRKPRCRRAAPPQAGLAPRIKIRSPNGVGAFASAAAMVAAMVSIAALALPWRSIAPIARPDAVGLFGRDHRHAASNLPRSATARSATPQANGVDQCRRPRASRRRSASSTRPTSRPIPRPASARGPIPPSSARCARASIATAGISIRRFPTTHFAKTTDADLQALYAYLMAQPAVRAVNRRNRARVSVQPASADGGMERAVSSASATFDAGSRRKSATWNRGAYLVEGLGHCGACHSPRNALGAEKAERLSRRRFCGGLGSAAADLAVACADPLERG